MPPRRQPYKRPDLGASEIHLWHASIDSTETARWALRTVLGRYLGTEPERIELRLGPHGKPELAGSVEPLRFNLSHSGELALVAIALEREVGVDVEAIKSRRDVLALARRGLNPDEAAGIERAAPDARSAMFHAAWTRREAAAKCLGAGLRAPLPETPTAVANIDVGPGFAAAIAVAGEELPPLRRFALEPDALARAAGGRR
jgi:phosphopantetheinyl transferase